MKNKYKVLVVDDSAAVCRFLEKVLSTDEQLEVVGVAHNALEAREKIKELQPDVLTLDIEMPHMNGLTFLKNIMRLRPMPVVMVSSLTAAGEQVALDALQIGAADFMLKSKPGTQEDRDAYIDELTTRVRDAASISFAQVAPEEQGADVDFDELITLKRKIRSGNDSTETIKRVVAIGASTGGPEALRQVLTSFYSPKCALVISQHMPDQFMESFAERLDSVSKFRIKLAENGEKILPGWGYVAPGGAHLSVKKKAGSLYCRLLSTGKMYGHLPSVGVMFDEVVKSLPDASVGLLLTGMGNDGSAGLAKMRQAGSATVVQDKNSSTVWGMPGRAFELGGADQVLSLDHIAPALNKLLS